ncbi:MULTISPECIES: O-antigen ligase family protein [Brevundimonas]|uniref:O-antigen ligase family protein n=2 Tax=Caulobacteraceae TaxID=76892 RepID=UPI0019083EBA|nr:MULTISPECIES: O-antigen ligase [Brevundimonas]MDA0743741.1 O-antigen ligase [Pseudomonadota bacterium]MBK1968935.1 O-antigen ligase family protein [Brevundimonas diminuta]MBK1975094.1 O-antigen ligase family protein [Brevundimonas diminuta]MDA1320825.1 O-antigen ligase [Pseudomonadota bacterium]MDM8351524.1 O-antigen ligase [Brevundimonas diminuta]
MIEGLDPGARSLANPAAKRPSLPLVRAAPLADIVAVVASVGLILTYVGFWSAPLTGYGARSADFLRNFYYPAYLLALILVCLRPERALKGLIRSPLLIALLLLTAATYFWSIMPELTARRIPALAFTTLAGVALASRWSWRSLTEIIAGTLAVLAILSFLVGALLPQMGRMDEIFPGAWRGLWLEKNSMGNVMVKTTVFLLAAGVMAPERRKLWFGLAVVPVLLILLSTSKTALVVLVLSLASMGFVAVVKSGPLRAVVATWLAVVFVIGAGLLIAMETDTFFALLGKDATLTGRTEIWSGIMQQMAEHPWKGFGYGAVWDDPSFTGPKAWIGYQAHFMPADAHSGWLELYIALGLGGVILFALFLTQIWAQSLWAAYTSPGGWLALPLIASFTVTMLTESIAMNWHELRWVIVVALALKLTLGDEPTAPSRPRLKRNATGQV